MSEMDIEALMLFYVAMENQEWEFVINSKPPDKIKPEDFAHMEFCAAVRRHMIVNHLKRALTSNYSNRRYWAGLGLYKYWTIERKFRCGS
jgi:hypothetical protein